LIDKILRLPLRLIPREAALKILSGPLRGKKWVAGAASHGYWLGTYERDVLDAFVKAIHRGATVYDIGANVGLYTLLASVSAGAAGWVYAFEPVERNLVYLRRHLALNKVENCQVLEVAVADLEGQTRFARSREGHSMGRLANNGELQVRCVTLDGCIYGRAGLRPPDVLKIDVEGAEREVLRGARRSIAEFHPTVFLEVHGTEQHHDCRDFLRGLGYELEETYGRLVAVWAERSR
jgi:FkbM family methyltransferase